MWEWEKKKFTGKGNRGREKDGVGKVWGESQVAKHECAAGA